MEQADHMAMIVSCAPFVVLGVIHLMVSWVMSSKLGHPVRRGQRASAAECEVYPTAGTEVYGTVAGKPCVVRRK